MDQHGRGDTDDVTIAIPGADAGNEPAVTSAPASSGRTPASWTVPQPTTTLVDRDLWNGDDPDREPDDDDSGPAGRSARMLLPLSGGHGPRRRGDWRWVEEWREEQVAPAWGPGVAVGGFVALLVAVAIVVLTSGVADSPVLAIVLNLVIGAGMAPALWLSRPLPVLRFLAGGAAVGLLCGWIWMLMTFASLTSA